MLSKSHRSTADYLFEKAEWYFCRARANLNARVALEAVGNAFMVKAIELDIKLSRPKAATPSNCPGTDASTADKLLADGSEY
jgi:hypothetical protein